MPSSWKYWPKLSDCASENDPDIAPSSYFIKRMKPVSKVSLVVAGYIIAILLAVAAVALRIVFTYGPDAQASSGMYAFGDALLFVAVFGVSALFPTGAALFFLRSYPRFWITLSVLAVGLAATALAAVLYELARHGPASPPAAWSVFSILRVLVTPLFALAFGLCAILSPYRYPRLALVAATVMEAGVSAYSWFIWFLPLIFDR
jgi:hypothetical protein